MKGIAALSKTERRAGFINAAAWVDFRKARLYLVSTGARQIRDRSFNSIAQMLTERTLDSPVVLLLDDIHWANSGFLDLLEYLAKLETMLPVLIVCAARPSLDESHPNWGGNFPLCTSITIRSLDLDASRELVNEILQNVSDLPRDLVETVAKNAEGNPFYLEELIKVLIEDGVIVKGEDLWQIVPHRVTQLRALLFGVLQSPS
jgi:predicted ATPase